MIKIKSIASYVPESSINNIDQAVGFGETEDFIRNKIGALHLPRMTAGEDASDLAVSAFQNLLDKNPDLNQENIDVVVVVTQNPDGEGLPHTSAIVQRKLQLPVSVAAFDISLGCSGYVYGLFALKGFLESSGLKNGVLLTADPYSKIVDLKDKATSLLFGDAATATWLGSGPGWGLGPVCYGTDGSGSEYLKKEGGVLHMNGRQVFNFAFSQIADNIKKLLEREGLKYEDIDLYCLHQGSNAIVDAIARNFGEHKERFVKDMEATGNTVSSSIPLLLENRLLEKEVNRILISGFGVGLSWATAIINRID
ncbi:ketoacyl-ACP synthase III [Castellaniella sp.]|uniref:ketoacyl-ACP synthase III n=1 Tax=Castellaniella sp. TaxID=1955812 RepID=UPI002AFF46E3|nr:ketoacyl-ACP synthase III [Castellaniella sp.]